MRALSIFIFATIILVLPRPVGAISQKTSFGHRCEMLMQRSLRAIRYSIFKPTTPEHFKNVQYGGFLTPLEAHRYGRGRIGRTVDNVLQFIPRRVVGVARGEGGRWRNALCGDPSFAVTPFNGLRNCLLDKPIFKTSEMLGMKKTYVAGGVLSFIFYSGIGIATYETSKEYIVTSGIDQTVESNQIEYREEYLNDIRYDIRFRGLRRYVQENPTPEALKFASEKAYWISLSNISFFENELEQEFVYSDEKIAYLLRYPQFEHLQGFYSPVNKLSPMQWAELVDGVKVYQIALELAKAKIDESPQKFDELMQDPDKSTIYKGYVAGAFADAVFAKLAAGEVTKNEAKSLLQERVYYKHRFYELRVLKEELPPYSLQEIEQDLLQEAQDKSQWDLGVRP